jgi:hypothetical protein
VSDRRSEPDPEPAALDVADEPEPEWAEGIRRARRERAERLRRLLATDEQGADAP